MTKKTTAPRSRKTAASPGRDLVPVRPRDGVPTVREMAGVPVAVDAVYHVPAVHPKNDGPWAHEADKVAWTDPFTGLGCIIRRNAQTGHLGGYCGVGPDHPLHGWEIPALAGLGLRVHAGISYSRECQAYESEEISICHVPAAAEPSTPRPSHERVHSHREGGDLWWIGFECAGPADALPKTEGRYAQPHVLDGVVAPVYRDEGYVFEQCRSLAAQLAAIADGRDPREAAIGDPPAIGVDPRRAHRS